MIELNASQVAPTSWPGRDFCFELINEGQRYVFQAASEEELEKWLSILKQSREGVVEPTVRLNE